MLKLPGWRSCLGVAAQELGNDGMRATANPRFVIQFTSGEQTVSDFELALQANLFDQEAVAKAAKAWLTGPGRHFLRLKASEVAAMMRSMAGCKTLAGINRALESHLDGRASRQKGNSPWSQTVSGGSATLRLSFMEALQSCVGRAGRLPPIRRAEPNPIEERLRRCLDKKQSSDFDSARQYQCAVAFLDRLKQIHQAQSEFEEEEKRCRKSLAS